MRKMLSKEQFDEYLDGEFDVYCHEMKFWTLDDDTGHSQTFESIAEIRAFYQSLVEIGKAVREEMSK